MELHDHGHESGSDEPFAELFAEPAAEPFAEPSTQSTSSQPFAKPSAKASAEPFAEPSPRGHRRAEPFAESTSSPSLLERVIQAHIEADEEVRERELDCGQPLDEESRLWALKRRFEALGCLPLDGTAVATNVTRLRPRPPRPPRPLPLPWREPPIADASSEPVDEAFDEADAEPIADASSEPVAEAPWQIAPLDWMDPSRAGALNAYLDSLPATGTVTVSRSRRPLPGRLAVPEPAAVPSLRSVLHTNARWGPSALPTLQAAPPITRLERHRAPFAEPVAEACAETFVSAFDPELSRGAGLDTCTLRRVHVVAALRRARREATAEPFAEGPPGRRLRRGAQARDGGGVEDRSPHGGHQGLRRSSCIAPLSL